MVKKIEKLIIDIKDNLNKKLEENINIINILKKKIEENKISLENNKKIINLLKREIFDINEKKDKIYEMYNKRENIINNLKNENKFLKNEINNFKNNSNPKNIKFSQEIINDSYSRCSLDNTFIILFSRIKKNLLYHMI